MVTGQLHTMQKLQENNILEPYFKELSIQINLDGLSFCVFNPVLNYVESIYNFSVNFNKSNQEIEKQVYTILQSEEDLRQDFNNIKVLHNTPAYTLIPQALFSDEKEAVNYLKYSIDTSGLKEKFIEVDKIIPIDIVNVYVPDVLINNILIEHYGMVDYNHFSSSLLRMLLKHYASHSYQIMYAYTEQSSFYFVVFKDKKLYHFNRFYYETTEDFLFYTLYCIEQLGIDSERIPLYVIGDFNHKSLVYRQLSRYIKYIYLMDFNRKEYYKGMDEELIRKNFVLTQCF
ncbi:conserved hypothetical protein [Capnocytophaga canis]|uniref:DUF3822 domain-containing protein n=2 Tax=Flavobacteriaceae TaxID=49546 RepID=A0A0B7HXA4_9FLAO|nr:conserved hypothetical protein [Capnocytophaga canis]CEN45928.1 conserved hypothetical protein [Capnocytophaga canis]